MNISNAAKVKKTTSFQIPTNPYFAEPNNNKNSYECNAIP
jgi:hypothetical protein